MASELLRVDIHELYMLAELKQQFALHHTSVLAAEIRLQRQCFGLTPLDRRRLEWSVEQVEEAKEKRQRKKAPMVEPAPAVENDPRRLLQVVR